MSIKFLDAHQASQQYLCTDYFQQMNYIELAYRFDSLSLPREVIDNCSTLRKKLRYYYTSLVSNFTDHEKNIIRF